MFIQTEAMPDANRMKFYPGEVVLSSGVAEFGDEEAAERSPLAARLFNIGGVSGATFYGDFITVIREAEADWQVLKPMILGAIMDHYASGQPILLDAATAGAPDKEAGFDIQDDPADAEIIDQIQDLMGTRIKPAADQMGGDVIYKAYKNGTVYVEFIGPTKALVGGMTNVIGHYIPEVQAVKDFRDAIPKPGLDTPIGKAIQVVLDEKVNPAVAGHGGHISLIDVKGDTAFIRLEGGCQGCGMADATLKQGVEVEIKSAVPEIISVLDVTDHAEGANPYYSAG
ncbi:MAG: NifU family protein [Rhodospirillales bacterium]|nr:NifU family protein [Rhodospirillales bacterium]